MSTKDELIKPTHCFCMIPDDDLKPWIIKKYRDHIPTLDLMLSTEDSREKEIISIVALIDVDDSLMLKMMENVPRTQEHILECRQNAKRLVEETLLQAS